MMLEGEEGAIPPREGQRGVGEGGAEGGDEIQAGSRSRDAAGEGHGDVLGSLESGESDLRGSTRRVSGGSEHGERGGRR